MDRYWLKIRPFLYIALVLFVAFQILGVVVAQEATPEANAPVDVIETETGTTIVVGSPEIFGISENLFLAVFVVLALFIYSGFSTWQNNGTWRTSIDAGLNRSVGYAARNPELFNASERIIQVVPKQYRYILNDMADWFDDTVTRNENSYPKELLQLVKNLTDDDPNTRELPPVEATS